MTGTPRRHDALLPGELRDDPKGRRSARDRLVDVLMYVIALGVGLVVLLDSREQHGDWTLLLDIGSGSPRSCCSGGGARGPTPSARSPRLRRSSRSGTGGQQRWAIEVGGSMRPTDYLNLVSPALYGQLGAELGQPPQPRRRPPRRVGSDPATSDVSACRARPAATPLRRGPIPCPYAG
jgi:hypothetical protein